MTESVSRPCFARSRGWPSSPPRTRENDLIRKMTISISGERTTVFTLDSVGFQGRRRGLGQTATVLSGQLMTC
jgi:hypothetical protein